MTEAQKAQYKQLRASLDNTEDLYLTALEAFREAERSLEATRIAYDNSRRQIITFIDIISQT